MDSSASEGVPTIPLNVLDAKRLQTARLPAITQPDDAIQAVLGTTSRGVHRHGCRPALALFGRYSRVV